MTKVRKLQTNFTSGEIDLELQGRTDLQIYQNGAAYMRNVRPLSSGGARRRPGLAYVADIPDVFYQHVEYIFNSGQTYQLLLSEGNIRVHDGVTGALLWTHAAPFLLGMIGAISVHSWGDYTFFAHPFLKTQRLKRTGYATFELGDFVYDQGAFGTTHPIATPFFKYVNGDIAAKLDVVSAFEARNGYIPGTIATITIVTTPSFWQPGHVGTYFMLGDGQWLITVIETPDRALATLMSAHCRMTLTENALQVMSDGTTVKVYDPFHALGAGMTGVIASATTLGGATYQEINGAHIVTGTDASNWYYQYTTTSTTDTVEVGGGPNIKFWSSTMRTVDWKEQMYSAVRGYPHCVGSYLGRLILGGGQQAPNRINMSQIETPYNFDTGTGQDDEAIQIGISGRRTPTVRHIVGGKNLQIFTSEGEYIVPHLTNDSNITPTNISIRPQTRYGILANTPPVYGDGATLFLSQEGSNLRQFVLGKEDDGYSSPNLSFPARHLIVEPYWLALQMEDAQRGEATCFVVNGTGAFAVFTMVRSEQIAAWSLWSTAGGTENFLNSCCCVDSRTFVVTVRTIDGIRRSTLEKFDESRLLDCSHMGTYIGRDGQDYVWGGFDFHADHPMTVVVDGRADIGLYTPNVAGEIRIPVPATTVEGGYGFPTRLTTLPPELALQEGPSPGEMRRVVSVNLKLKESLGVMVRDRKILNTRAQMDLGVAAPLITGNVLTHLMGWDMRGQVDITQSSNAPMTILAANVELEF